MGQATYGALRGCAGGTIENPSYRQVCAGNTGHAGVVHVTFDPAQVSYDRLLDVFFASHDPTTLNRQGPDYGSQYRSVIFDHTPAQEAADIAKKMALNGSGQFRHPIVTRVEPFPNF